MESESHQGIDTKIKDADDRTCVTESLPDMPSSSSSTNIENYESLKLDQTTKNVLNNSTTCPDSLEQNANVCNENSNNMQGDDSSDPSDNDVNAVETSDMSEASQESWQPISGPMNWVHEQMRQGKCPRKILEELVPSGTEIPEDLNPIMLWKIIINIVSEPPKRKKLNTVNTLDDVIGLLKTCKKVIVLTGAGVSVSCGIPDFRSRDGVYARLAKDFPNLPDPQAMFDIFFFRNDPRPFFKFAKEIYPGQFKPSLCHYFIKLLEDKGILLRNYTQNIDTLEQVAGIKRVVQCHGSFAAATCTMCGLKVNSDAIKEDIFNQVIPRCPKCSPSKENAIMKPDIVFFGESLPEEFHSQMALDKDQCDLLIVIGSSLKVRPVALIPNALPAHVPQILINRERLSYLNFDVELCGNCDDIIGDLCRRLGHGWDQLAPPGSPLTEILMSALPTPPESPSPSLINSNLTTLTKNDEVSSVRCTKNESVEEKSGHISDNKSSLVCENSSVNLSECCGENINNFENENCVSRKRSHDEVCTEISDSNLDNSDNLNKEEEVNDKGKINSHSAEDSTSESEVKKIKMSIGTDCDNGGEDSLLDDDLIENAMSMPIFLKKTKVSLATRLTEDQVLFIPPSRYVYKGAEVYSNDDSDDSEDESCESSSVGDEDISQMNKQSTNPAVIADTCAEICGQSELPQQSASQTVSMSETTSACYIELSANEESAKSLSEELCESVEVDSSESHDKHRTDKADQIEAESKPFDQSVSG